MNAILLFYFLINFSDINSLTRIENLVPFNLNINSEIILEYKNPEIKSQSNSIILFLKPYIMNLCLEIYIFQQILI